MPQVKLPGLLTGIGVTLVAGAAMVLAGSVSTGDQSASATSSPIKHVVIIIKENHSFDNLFGQYPGADGTVFKYKGQLGSWARKGKKFVRMTTTPDRLQGDIRHGLFAALRAVNGGKMNRFYKEEYAVQRGQDVADSQFGQAQIPNYWEYAEDYGLADHFFSTIMGASFTNHLALIAGSSMSAVDDPVKKGKPDAWGCDSGKGTYVMVSRRTHWARTFPCFNQATVADEANKVGVTWRYYAPPAGQFGYIWSSFDAVKHIRYSKLYWYPASPGASAVLPTSQFDTDVAADSLPQISWVVPGLTVSDHPPESMCQGEAWTVDRINEVMKSPLWSSTVIFLLWDDYGGFYDHVRVPRPNAYMLGPRVPVIAISPFAKHTISHEQFDFRSLIKYLEQQFHLPHLAKFSRKVHSLGDMLDVNQAPLPAVLQETGSCPAATTRSLPLYPGDAS